MRLQKEKEKENRKMKNHTPSINQYPKIRGKKQKKEKKEKKSEKQNKKKHQSNRDVRTQSIPLI